MNEDVMSDELIIANGVTLYTLNRHNAALKNDFNGNLLATAFMLFPAVTDVIGDKRIQIKYGFLPRPYVFQEITSAPSYDLMKHTMGMAIEFTWEDWTEEDALLIATELFDDLDEHVKIILDPKNKTLFFGRDYKYSSIIEKNSSGNRIIRRKDAA